MYKIEKGIPVPGALGRKKYEFPFDSMDIGDSFFVETDKVRSVQSLVQNSKRNGGRKFTTRTVENGVRIWRIA